MKLVAVDTEFLRDRTYYPKLCLVQLATHEQCALVDPLADLDLTPLADLLADASVTKVFHSCSQDLAALYDALGVDVVSLFDTQVAAAYLGMRLQASYGDVVVEYCGVRLAKAEALTDWSVRPLTAEQLAYATDDVRYLPGIYDDMVQKLVELNRLSWVSSEMELLSQKAQDDRNPYQAYVHLKRASTLTRKQLAIAREACAWRELRAAELDIPRRWLVSDEVIVECCRRVPRDAADLRRIRGAEKLKASEASGLLAALRKGTHASTADVVRMKRRDRPSAESEGVLELMGALVRISSNECGIAPQLLASRDDLYDLMRGRNDAALKMGWRYEVIGKRLEQLLAGELALTVRDNRIEVL